MPSSSFGNMVATEKLTTEFHVPTIEIMTPLILLGNISESKAHITGPSDMANEATYKISPINTNIAFIEIAFSRIADLKLL